ncbi:hypothetical protein ACIOKD_20990 [Streptomyces sp. NPDC087844]|uniref:hypothetical protein n=1 Tax=Streptomyces sp. NPDC087844 TaxID=3365805 RepID=UPI0037FEA119
MTTTPARRTGRLLALLSPRRTRAARPARPERLARTERLAPKPAAGLGKGDPGEGSCPDIWLAALRLLG